MPTSSDARSQRLFGLALLCGIAVGCGGPSQREVQNRRELEALLTAISLKDAKELESDARRLAARHDTGELSDASFADLSAIVDRARSGDWADAERRAYALRTERPYFK